mgnify:CR=1 FL=1
MTQTPADRLAALERQVATLSARLSALEQRGIGSPTTDPERAARAHRERLTGRPACPQCQGAAVILDADDNAHPCPSCHPTTKGHRP